MMLYEPHYYPAILAKTTTPALAAELILGMATILYRPYLFIQQVELPTPTPPGLEPPMQDLIPQNYFVAVLSLVEDWIRSDQGRALSAADAVQVKEEMPVAPQIALLAEPVANTLSLERGSPLDIAHTHDPL